MASDTGRERRCIWCSLPKFGDGRCVCDDPTFILMEQCGRCGTWRDVDHVHVPTDSEDETPVCSDRCVMADGGTSSGDTDQFEPRQLTIQERILDFIARLYREPPTCGGCDEPMRWMGGAWDCPNLFREDHRVETEDGGVLFTTVTEPDDGYLHVRLDVDNGGDGGGVS